MKRLLTSCFGLGWLPFAPGTYGSVPPAIVFVVLCRTGASAQLILTAMITLALAGALVCIGLTPAAMAATGKNDPREVVADEFAGQALALLPISLLTTCTFSNSQIWIITALAFGLFRMFDIAKPWPIRKLEKLPQGWGILADDLMAGLYAAVCLVILGRFVL